MTGTDTGAGKTYVTALIIRALRAEGVDAVGYKPICCGGREDAYTLQEASGGDVDLDHINPCYLRTAAAPYVAAMFENAELELPPLIEGFKDLAAEHEVVIVEGVGGWRGADFEELHGGGFCQGAWLADNTGGWQPAGGAEPDLAQRGVHEDDWRGTCWTDI